MAMPKLMRLSGPVTVPQDFDIDRVDTVADCRRDGTNLGCKRS